jgi:hypothetical protein
MTMDGMPPLVLNDVALFVSQHCTCRGTAQAKPVSQSSDDSDHFIAGQRAAIVDPHRSASPARPSFSHPLAIPTRQKQEQNGIMSQPHSSIFNQKID